MRNLFESDIAFRSLIRERTPALVEQWEELMWFNQAIADIARRTLCYEREVIVPATDNIRKYEWKYILPDFAGKVRLGWYRNFPLNLIQDLDSRGWTQSFFNSTSSQPFEFYYDSQAFGIKWIPDVTTYSTGTALFTNGSTTVTGTATLWLTGTSPPAVHWAIGTGTEPGKHYSIRSVDSETQITLEEPFREATTTSTTYRATNGAVRLIYAATPPVLRSIAYTTGLGAAVTVTSGSRAVSSSGAPALLTNARRGMHFGNGTATGSTKPAKWYIVRSVDSNTALTLEQPYEEATAAGTASGVLTDDSPFEPTIMEAVVFYAAAMALRKVSHPDSGALFQLYEGRVQQIKGEVDSRYQRHAPLPRIQSTFISELDWY